MPTRASVNTRDWDRRVAVIGAGPAGLVAARYLVSEGFEPIVYERSISIGGQWSGHPMHSGIWPSLRTNTSRVLTAFSDLPHADALPVYPSNQQILAYLHRYAERYQLTSRIRFEDHVLQLRRGARGWLVRRREGEEEFARVVVASGRFHAPSTPVVSGLSSFTGSEGVSHTYAYKHPERYRGKRVLVAGCAVSALEIASDLAMLGAESVTVTLRRQRYVLPKTASGVPTDHLVFTRYGVLAEERLPRADVAQLLKELVLKANGSPEQYGAPQPADDMASAGLTLSQYYLSLVAEGRIDVRPWIAGVQGDTVHFTDGRSEPYDAIIFGTGFALDLPFLDADLRQTLALDPQHIELDRHTFHPELPGLAFLGLWDQAGPYFPPLELQARWVAYAWSGACSAPTHDELVQAVAAYRARRHQSPKTRMNVVAVAFARAAGVEPTLARWPSLARALLFGPLSPSSFRLEGPDALADAAERCAADAAAFGCLIGSQWSSKERAMAEGLGLALPS